MPRTPERSHRGGHSGVSIEDVAAAAGVSTATVSRAVRGLPRVSPATRQKILDIADSLGYVASSAASGLATGRTRNIGVMSPFVGRWYFARAIEGADLELRSRQYNLSLFNLGGSGSNRERLFHRTMVDKQIDALMVLCMALTREEIEHLQNLDIPLVVVGGPVEDCNFISVDDHAVSAAAARHLIDLGHRDIALLHGQDETGLKFDVPLIRKRAFDEALASAGLTVRPEWDIAGDFTLESGQRAIRELWARPGAKPTAVSCASDEMALGVVFEAARMGIRVPEDLSVIGIDNHEFSAAVGLTTVGQDPEAQGRLGIRMLLDELEGAAGAVHSEVAPHRLIVRETTAPPRVASASVPAAKPPAATPPAATLPAAIPRQPAAHAPLRKAAAKPHAGHPRAAG